MNERSSCPDARAPADAPPLLTHVPPELVLDTRFGNGAIPNDLVEPYVPSDVLPTPAMPRINY